MGICFKGMGRTLNPSIPSYVMFTLKGSGLSIKKKKHVCNLVEKVDLQPKLIFF